MMSLIRLCVVTSLLLSTFTSSMSSARAETVQFTSRELGAVETLLKPESATLTLHGKSGAFDPPKSLRSLGVESEKFDINMNFILNLIDLRFDRVVGRNLSMKFAPGGMEIQLEFDNRVGALRSHVGRIDTKNVRLTAVIDWKERAGGRREMILKSMRFGGTLRGSGIMRSRVVLGRTKKLAMKIFANQIERIMDRAEVQDSIRNGLSGWARMSVGSATIEADPTTFRFTSSGNSSSLTFETMQRVGR